MNREERRRQHRFEEKREITEATISGRIVPAALLICPDCNILDLNASFDTDDPVEWIGYCTSNHEWTFNVVDCPKAEE